MAAGTLEPEETALVRKLLQEVDVLVNVGANVGYYCCHALSLGKPVIAVEPIAGNLHYLLANIRNNGWTAYAEVFPMANGRDELLIPNKVTLDVAYLQKQSLSFDIRILWITLVKVLRRDGVSH